MKFSTAIRILSDQYRKPGLRQTYWDLSALAKEMKSLLFHPHAGLRRYVRGNLLDYCLCRTRPVPGQAGERAQAAADWLIRSQASTPDDGSSLGYFPNDGIYEGWYPSYPETTGYIITSLLRFARQFDDSRAREAALKMAKWEISVQMATGAVQGGPLTTPDKQTPAAFNTGMVLDGWCSAYQETGDAAFLEAGRKAADFLANDLDEDGYFKTNGQYVSAGEIKTYTCLCAWAMYRFGVLAEDARYVEAAVRAVEAAIRQQQGNGWFAHNCLSRSGSPLTHTHGYALQGILEVGILAGREDFVEAARRGVDPILPQIAANGYLPGRFYPDWEPASFSACLTGNAQIAIVCFRLAEHTGNPAYASHADRLVDFLKSVQSVDPQIPQINGALAGAYPLFGEYMRSGYPNWATKYLLDALMMQRAHSAD
jgi:hypothetical protein